MKQIKSLSKFRLERKGSSCVVRMTSSGKIETLSYTELKNLMGDCCNMLTAIRKENERAG